MKKGESALLGLVIGLLAGVSVGILYAPEKGTHVRRRLSYRLDKYKKILTETIEHLVESKQKYESTAKVEEKKRKEAMIEKAEKLMTEIDDLSNKIKSRVN